MEWLFEPATWIGLITLVFLEVVLGVDNVVFIAILAGKLPKHQQTKAEVTGLVLAMVIRLALLTVLSWMTSLTEPLLSIYRFSFSGRDIILIIGGLFLLFKASSELHERLEGNISSEDKKQNNAGFWVVVIQIVVLDTIFSLDAVVTAVGIVSHLPIMMAAVIISIIIMMFMLKPLTTFMNRHQTVVVLCLSFLLMIGLSLVAKGMEFEIPEGYLYVAIGFSLLIEFFNQIGKRNAVKNMSKIPLRERTADAVLHLLGAKSKTDITEIAPETQAVINATPVFGEKERNMVSGVLTLGERSIRSIMTPRNDIVWIDITDDADNIQKQLRNLPHSYYPICEKKLDSFKGIARSQDIVDDLHLHTKISNSNIHDAIVIPEGVGVLQVIDLFKSTRGQMGLVVDEYGSIEGLVTPIDILEAIAGEFPDENESLEIKQLEHNSWEIDGATDLYSIEQTLDIDGLIDDDQEYSTLNGFILERLGKVPAVGQSFDYENCHFEIIQMDGQRIESVKITKLDPSNS